MYNDKTIRNKATLNIRKPNDAGQYWQTILRSDTKNFGSSSLTTNNERRHKDPVHSGLVEFWSSQLRVYRHSYNRGRYNRGLESGDYEHTVYIQDMPVILTKSGIRYYINGKAESLSTITHALARVTFKSAFEKDAGKLMKVLLSSLNLSENIKYCLENRAPYHFYHDFQKVECRLNIMQISKDECAIEVSDGLWGTLKNKELESYCSFYVHSHKKGRWKYVSPENLFTRTIGRSPSEGELELMVAFLQQNRTQDLVDKRAIELVNDLLLQHGDRLKAVYEGKELMALYVRGKDYDWKLTNDKFKSDIQMVSTWVNQPPHSQKSFDELINARLDIIASNEKLPEKEHAHVPDKPTNEWRWKGPICIDNMSKGSPLGDQFAARALALLNDTFTIKIVSTINGYLIEKPDNINNNRVDFNEM